MHIIILLQQTLPLVNTTASNNSFIHKIINKNTKSCVITVVCRIVEATLKYLSAQCTSLDRKK